MFDIAQRKLKMEPSYSLSRSQTEFLPRLATAPSEVISNFAFFLSKNMFLDKIQVIWELFPAILAIFQNYNTDLQKVI